LIVNSKISYNSAKKKEFPMTGTRITAWSVWLIASVFYAYQYILRVMPNIMIDDIMAQFDIGAKAFGQFSGVYYIGYSLMHLPLGIMLDRFGPKKVMSGCILLSVVGMLPLIFANWWVYPIVGRALVGMGSSAAILGVFKIIRMAFDEKHFSRMLSFSVTIGLIGAIYGGGPISYMQEIFGFRPVIESLAAAGICLAILTYIVVPDVSEASSESVLSNIKEVFSNRKIIWTCVAAGMMVGPIEGFADVWSTLFLKQNIALEGAVAASLPSMIFIGMCFGGPVLSFIAERIGSNVLTIVGAGLAMTAAFWILLLLHMTPAAITVLFILIGICCGYQILAIYQASTYARKEVAGLSTAMANMIIMIFGYVFHTAIGMTVDAMGGPSHPVALAAGVAVVPAGLCLGSLGFMTLHAWERRTQRIEA
jgi:predicted MFS family arabinose efflux permease